MKTGRPNIDLLPDDVRNYILGLEEQLEELQHVSQSTIGSVSFPKDDFLVDISFDSQLDTEQAEPPTTINVITATASGLAKRTPRHLYARQHRGGMGIFDLESGQTEPPIILSIADERQTALLITDFGRAFRLPVSAIPETVVRGRGTSIVGKLNLSEDEKLAFITPEQAEGYLALVSKSGMVRLLRHHVFGEYMKPGTALYDFRNFGFLASACWTTGEQDLFLATRQGRAIRFSEKLVPPQGALGIRLADTDEVAAISAVHPDSGIFLLGSDGKGTIRLMEGFSANKSPGAGGKIAMTVDELICALTTDDHQDVFIITGLSKIIRFALDQIPAKESVVQGVVCMTLRADHPVAAVLA